METVIRVKVDMAKCIDETTLNALAERGLVPLERISDVQNGLR